MTKEQNIRIDYAADFLRRRGYLIVDSHATPIKSLARKVIHLVAWEEKSDTMVGVSVYGSPKPTPLALRRVGRLATKDAQARFAILMRRWCKTNKWHGKQMIASCGVFGNDDKPLIDFMWAKDTSPTKLKWC